jgi:hypothetical protein
MIETECKYCLKNFLKKSHEFNKVEKVNGNHFCSISCCRSYRNKTEKLENRYNISIHSDNQKDEFTLFRYHLKLCKQRKKEFNISLQDLKDQWEKQKGICPYFKISLKLLLHKHSEKPSVYNASVDRIDSTKGYIKGNIQFVSCSANYLKSQFSHEEMLDLCKLIAINYS